MPDSGASMANFIHTSRPMFGGMTASMPARWQASRSASVRALGLPSASPNSRLQNLPVCLMTPGSAMCAPMRATPGTTLPAPTTLPTRSALSTPFWNVKTVAPLATSGSQASGGALRVAHLDREQDGIGRRNLARVGHHLHGLEVQRAELAVETQTASPHGLQMRAARHEGHVVAGRRQARAEVAADAARPHHRNLHGVITTRPTILPARRSSSERLVSPSGARLDRDRRHLAGLDEVQHLARLARASRRSCP